MITSLTKLFWEAIMIYEFCIKHLSTSVTHSIMATFWVMISQNHKWCLNSQWFTHLEGCECVLGDRVLYSNLGLYHNLCAFLMGLRMWKSSLEWGQRFATLPRIFKYVLDGFCKMEQDTWSLPGYKSFLCPHLLCLGNRHQSASLNFL